jgi:uncharacterized protein (AIM24 family)
MPVPVLKPTSVRDEAFAGLRYHVEGELVPVLHIELWQMPIYFEHHILLWKEPQVQIGMKRLAGAFKRIIAGMPIVMVQAVGPGQIGFSRDGAGHVFGIHFQHGQALDVREHQWLAATESLDYTFNRVKGFANMMFSGTGLFIYTFHCVQAEGILWLHGYGNVFEINLAPGQALDVEPGGWIYKDPSVRMETIVQQFTTGIFGSAGQLVCNRFFGPGRLGIQSMSLFVSEGAAS